jgi:2-hydroxychromene-2-carboxylate isomerase
MTRFAINFDYLCPFAYIANDLTIRALRDGADHEVEFLAFSLSQVHLEEGARPVWQAEPLASGVLALQWGLAVRDHFPERFHDAHLALFAARHDKGLSLNDPEVIRDAVASAGLDPVEVEKVVAGGGPLRALAADHTRTVEQHHAFGVPTFFAGDRAVFVRLMRRAKDGPDARATLDRLLDLVIGWQDLNELKATRIPR